MDIYSLLKLLSGGLVHILFKNKIARRRIVKVLKKVGDNQEELEEFISKVAELKPLFKAKKAIKYLDDKDIDKYLKNYLKKRGVDIDVVQEKLENLLTKKGKNKLKNVLGIFDEIDRVDELKNQQLLKEVEDLGQLANKLKRSIEEYKKDLRVKTEKALNEKKADIEELDVEKIKEEAIREFIEKQRQLNPNLKQGVRLGGRRKL